jgi:endonuclease/exonuclease/phosphatase family metal-dependent hydrolase
VPKEGPVPKSYTFFLIAVLAGGGWYFTTGPGQGKLGDIFAAVSRGQSGAQGQGQPGGMQNPPSGNYANYGNYNNYPAPSSYGAPPAGTQVPASYASQSAPVAPPPTPMFGGPAIRIASFNIQVFGDAKASKPYVMATLAAIIQNFQIVAIQEIRTQDDYFLDNFLRTYVNTSGRFYDKVIGPRLGRSNSKEQYAFLYDTATIEVNRRGVFTVNDPDDLLHREPLVAMFRVRGPPPEQAFTFVLVNIHTDPDETTPEINALAQVYQAVRRASGGEDDIILLGDLNVDDKHLGDLGQLDGVKPIVRGVTTNTRQNEQYDNIILHQPSTTEFSGRWGVYDIQRLHNLSREQALQVSDHYPVWAEFSAYESATPGRVAERPARVVTQ